MQKIIPNLWFDGNTEEAVNLYTSIFLESKMGKVMHYDAAGAAVSGMPEGAIMTIDFTLAGQNFVAINGGSYFKFTPATSLSVVCESEEEVDRIYNALSPGGKVLMELNKYDFAEKYAWIDDKFGLSWQIAYMKEATVKQKIIPSLMFIHQNYCKAKEAMEFYVSVFKDGKVEYTYPYPEGSNEMDGALAHAQFDLFGQKFIAMDSGYDHKFDFTGAVSFMVNCETQKEIDEYWEKLSSDPGAEQCGWLRDKYGLSWQIVPNYMNSMLDSDDKEAVGRAMKAMFGMKKINIAGLKEAAGERAVSSG